MAEARMRMHEQAECPVTHFFTPGLYIRHIFMPAGTLVASKLHKTCHPYFVLRGRCTVRIGDRWEEIEAGHMGITHPGTHRLLYIYEDTVWVTIHANPDNLADLKVLEEMIIQPHSSKCPGSLPPSP